MRFLSANFFAKNFELMNLNIAYMKSVVQFSCNSKNQTFANLNKKMPNCIIIVQPLKKNSTTEIERGLRSTASRPQKKLLQNLFRIIQEFLITRAKSIIFVRPLLFHRHLKAKKSTVFVKKKTITGSTSLLSESDETQNKRLEAAKKNDLKRTSFSNPPKQLRRLWF